MSEYTEFLNEVFRKFGTIHARKMFGGYGIYHQELMFALVSDDELYLKVDKQSKPRFEAAGLTPFTYEKNGKPYSMSYYQAPEEIFDDPLMAQDWANEAFDAAMRAKSKKVTP